MRMKGVPPTGKRLDGRLLAGLCLLAVAAAIMAWLVATRPPAAGPDPSPAPEAAPSPSSAEQGETVAVGDADPVEARTPRPYWEPTPAEALANPDCGIAAGWGMPAGDVALVVVPNARDGDPVGARFAVLDERGALHGGELPFRPNHWRLGRRADGAVVTAFADLRLNSKVFRPPDSPEPLRVYLDGGLVYESRKARSFGVARDGGSFFFIEPLAGEASRLVIRNLDLGTETHHDLGGMWNPYDAYESPYGASYSLDYGEVRFWPPQVRDGSMLGDYWFYPVDGGAPRVVRVVDADEGAPPGEADAVADRMAYVERVSARTDDRMVFESSEVAYRLADRSENFGRDGPFLVSRYEYDGYGSPEGPRREEAWLREVPMSVSTWAEAPDGPWLALRDGARRVLVLDKRTGEEKLAFPTKEDPTLRIPEESKWLEVPGAGGMNGVQWVWASATLARLRGVLGPDADVGDVGHLGGMWFEDGNRLVLARSLGDYPNVRTFYDVFEMDTVAPDGGPAFRIEKDDAPCGLGGLRGLEVRDGRLTYPGPRAEPGSDRAWAEPSVDAEKP